MGQDDAGPVFHDGSAGIVRQNQFSWKVPMSTSVNVNAAPSLQDRIRALAEGGKFWRAAIWLLVAGGFVLLVAGTIYLNSLVGPADLGQIFAS
jgi:hypothetical protein